MFTKSAKLLAAFLVSCIFLAGCKDETPVRINPDDLLNLKASTPVNKGWIFESRPEIVVRVVNPNPVEVTAEIKVRIKSDKKESITTIDASEPIPADGYKDVTVVCNKDLAPGFYNASCLVNYQSSPSFTFGVNPFEIQSPPDKQPDFDTFWDDALSQLEAVDMKPVLTKLDKMSSESRSVYFVEFYSSPDGPDGDPVMIHGYFAEPNDGEKHPVIIHYFGYDVPNPEGQISCPTGGGSSEWSEFWLSNRGQQINNRTAAHRSDGVAQDFANIYGDWFVYSFGDKDHYYYRGAYMDCVQAVRFLSTRATTDTDNIFAEGHSQGGAFSYAAAALSPIPLRAIAPNCPFMGDFPDYFQVAYWPASVANASKGSMTDAQMYAFLSYFDTKNLATRIHEDCAVYSNIGLQDVTCPPHTNIAPFNNLSVKNKEMQFSSQLAHSYPASWDYTVKAFFKKHSK